MKSPSISVLVLFAAELFCISAVAEENEAPHAAEKIQAAVRAFASPDETESAAARSLLEKLSPKDRSEALRRGLDDPQTPVSYDYLENLAISSAVTPEQLVSGTKSMGSMTIARIPVDSRDSQGRSRFQVALAQLGKSVNKKSGHALLTSYLTLCYEKCPPAPDDELKRKFSEAFESLTAARCEAILDRLHWFDNLPQLNWAALSCNKLNATLKELVKGRGALSNSTRQKHFVRANALLALSKTSPGEARELVVEELKKPQTGIKMYGLLHLNDATLPELTDTFRAHLKGEHAAHFIQAIERYGTAELLPDVKAWFNPSKGRWACDFQDAALRFIIKHDRENGLAIVRECLGCRGDKYSACYQRLISTVLKDQNGEDVNRLALDFIFDRDASVSAQARSFLFKSKIGREALQQVMDDPKTSASGREVIKQFIKKNEDIDALREKILQQDLKKRQSLSLQRVED